MRLRMEGRRLGARWLPSSRGLWLQVYLIHIRKRSPAMSLQGAVIRQDADPRKEIPIADVEISAANVFAASDCKSDSSGFFWLALPAGIAPGQPVTLLFRHPGYQPLEVNALAGDKIYVARMVPISHEASDAIIIPRSVIANVDVRYSIKSTAVANVGSVVKTFQAVEYGQCAVQGRQALLA